MKDQKLSRVGNLSRGLMARGATLIVPALISLLALGGVTARPVMNIAAAREALSVADQRAAEARIERANWKRHESQRTIASCERLVANIRARIPRDCPNLLAHGTVRLAADQAGLVLDRLEVGLDSDSGLAFISDGIALRHVAVAGRARLPQIVALLSRLSALGFPTCVEDVTLRRGAGDSDFEFHLALGLLHFVESAQGAVEGQAGQEQP